MHVYFLFLILRPTKIINMIVFYLNEGHFPSCANVSMMYRKGDGVEKNQEKSQEFKDKAIKLKKALEHGVSEIKMGQ